MKKLHKYIIDLTQYEEYWRNEDVEEKINIFIKTHYSKIKLKNYVSVISFSDNFFNVVINPEFEEEMLVHYPEEFI